MASLKCFSREGGRRSDGALHCFTFGIYLCLRLSFACFPVKDNLNLCREKVLGSYRPEMSTPEAGVIMGKVFLSAAL